MPSDIKGKCQRRGTENRCALLFLHHDRRHEACLLEPEALNSASQSSHKKRFIDPHTDISAPIRQLRLHKMLFPCIDFIVLAKEKNKSVKRFCTYKTIYIVLRYVLQK